MHSHGCATRKTINAAVNFSNKPPPAPSAAAPIQPHHHHTSNNCCFRRCMELSTHTQRTQYRSTHTRTHTHARAQFSLLRAARLSERSSFMLGGCTERTSIALRALFSSFLLLQRAECRSLQQRHIPRARVRNAQKCAYVCVDLRFIMFGSSRTHAFCYALSLCELCCVFHMCVAMQLYCISHRRIIIAYCFFNMSSTPAFPLLWYLRSI